jgi:hypothetical protein
LTNDNKREQDRNSDATLELVTVFKGASRNLIIIFLFHNHKATSKLKTICASTEIQSTLYQERAVSGKMKMDPAKRAQTQNTGEVSSLECSFSNPLK